jgi:ribonuclease-3
MADKTVDFTTLEERIGYSFNDKALLARALTHPSYLQGNTPTEHNQRLEFLGDAVLGLVLAEALFAELPAEREGTLTRFRSMLAKGNQLALIAREIQIGKALRIGEAEDSMGVRDRPSILEDALEALIGAVYRDGGLEKARKLVLHLYGPLSARLDFQMDAHNPKGRLQEIHQPKLGNQSIEYRLVEESGPDHCKHFTVEVWIDGTCCGRGSGNSKKLAEEAAALEALDSP